MLQLVKHITKLSAHARQENPQKAVAPSTNPITNPQKLSPLGSLNEHTSRDTADRQRALLGKHKPNAGIVIRQSSFSLKDSRVYRANFKL